MRIGESTPTEDIMFHLNADDWPAQNADPWRVSRPSGGIAPLRHEVELARYLEKQAGHRTSKSLSVDLWSVASRGCASILHGSLAAIRGLRPAVMERPRDLTG